ncbi:MAG: ribbon-helix-helix protein, CopG family [Elusimicrobia bacterium]|nr:ribbon-helix-helix protein, CopG family [Elusimicrobiota bacterium]
MKKTMIYLPDDLHKNLKRLAVERDTSMAELMRDAALAVVEEGREDLEDARKALQEFRRDPSSAVPLAEYHRRRKR